MRCHETNIHTVCCELCVFTDTQCRINAHICCLCVLTSKAPLSPESFGGGMQVGGWMRLKVKAFQFYLTLNPLIQYEACLCADDN